ncbi:hypothetical protein DFP72DRAFT_1067515 [Ephemerocybe angulata]|uniref:Uncharacterized protein n=1 Tax=Ephemerocybe angulata TaxID=980116 RepID=A0A8H6I0J6_9AGAR|nr:hypothetical protein DFP72DRAFT_1067515 [Tulosesus angulatus]
MLCAGANKLMAAYRTFPSLFLSFSHHPTKCQLAHNNRRSGKKSNKRRRRLNRKPKSGAVTSSLRLQRTTNNGEAFDTIQRDEEFVKLANFISDSFEKCAPDCHAHYRMCTSAIETRYNHLQRPFPSSVYPTVTINFGRKTVCLPHRDHANLPYGLCGITALGDFDADKGGHLVLWELKLIIRFPPGSTILIPSSIVTHSNIAVSQSEDRFSFTQYAAGDLFRWVENGFQTHAGLFGTEKPKTSAVSAHYRNLDYRSEGMKMLKSYC